MPPSNTEHGQGERPSNWKRLALLLLLLFAALLGGWALFVWTEARHGRGVGDIADDFWRVKSGNIPPDHHGNCSPKTDGTKQDKHSGNSPANRPPDSREAPPPESGDIRVDLRISPPTASGAVGWSEAFYSNLIIAGGAVRSNFIDRSLPPPYMSGSDFIYPDVLYIRAGGAKLCLALMGLLHPVDRDGNEIAGSLTYFAGHVVIEGEALASTRRITLEANAPSRDVKLLFPAEAAGRFFFVELIHINQYTWKKRPEALTFEPAMWPSEIAPEFREVKRRGDEYTRFSNYPRAQGIIGRDSQVELRKVPYGFGLPATVLLQDALDPDGFSDSCIMSGGDGTRVPNMHGERWVTIPRDGATISYLRAADDLLPQIRLTGPLVASTEDWPKYHVQCRVFSDQGDPYGFPIAQASYSANLGKWQWLIEPALDISTYLGGSVRYTLEEVGTARVSVDGLLSPTPEISLEVKRPERPWIIRAVVWIDGEQMQIPLKYTYGFGARQFTGKALTDESGNFILSGLEGPISIRELEESSFFSLEFDEDTIATLLVKLCSPGSEATASRRQISASPLREIRPQKDFTSRRIEDTFRFTTSLTWEGQAYRLIEFIRKKNIYKEFNEEVKKITDLR